MRRPFNLVEEISRIGWSGPIKLTIFNPYKVSISDPFFDWAPRNYLYKPPMGDRTGYRLPTFTGLNLVCPHPRRHSKEFRELVAWGAERRRDTHTDPCLRTGSGVLCSSLSGAVFQGQFRGVQTGL